MISLGFDTSNYTTSAAIFDSEKNEILQSKILLSVELGARGLRQSEALFQHVSNIPKVLQNLKQFPSKVDCVAASEFPRLVENSYMPCFLAGKSAAMSAAFSSNVPYFFTSHQHGHIVAALFSCGRMDLLKNEFYALHLSGGTTEILHCTPDSQNILNISILASTLDISAGQVIDRTGVLLGLKFPCGAELDSLSQKSNASFKIRPSIKNGNCCLSGVENQVKNLIQNGYSKEDVSYFAISSVISAIDAMLSDIFKTYPKLPIVFSGGVSSNSMLRHHFLQKYDSYFAAPEFSCDNAAGVAIIGYLKQTHGNFNCNSN